MGATTRKIDTVEQQFDAADRALKEGHADQAYELLDSLLRDHPTHYRSLLLQGAIAMGKSQYAKCEIYTRAALKLLPEGGPLDLQKAVVMAQLADSLQYQGKNAEARKIRLLLERANLSGAKANAGEGDEGQPVREPNSGRDGREQVKPMENSQSVGVTMEKPLGDQASQSSMHKPIANIRKMVQSPLWTQDELIERKVVYVGMRQREILNALREVRIKLLEGAQDDNLVVLVSSLKVGGGASFFAYNLAATFALDPNKTALYVDCNPYDSCADRYVNGVITKGLSHYLQDSKVQIEEIIYSSGVERVRVIPGADSNESAAELFYTQRMKLFINEIKNRYPDRFIILDAPSIQSSTEARILAQYCDKALLLVPFGKATKDEVMAGVDAVGRGRFAGLVFNY
ncbi:tyrosine-protein kinase family protein [Simiduia agarivorans]|uniref:Polysaccharide biosynthesis protein n=1 Tax=Simiduia agarivorans (strain DSM 21679 / JCM 13881 / BCRC 17597 / SA1) TaxID=1117647 RepID=K4KIV9_SIMAS|nr:CpsD/CapB family tyrosine-protein kinase [Simiduia agarivorans]AFU98966.1 putative polysaccharide biosynthesis protein [Simiduia agarivorans SA1 = DSM 21679]